MTCESISYCKLSAAKTSKMTVLDFISMWSKLTLVLKCYMALVTAIGVNVDGTMRQKRSTADLSSQVEPRWREG